MFVINHLTFFVLLNVIDNSFTMLTICLFIILQPYRHFKYLVLFVLSIFKLGCIGNVENQFP